MKLKERLGKNKLIVVVILAYIITAVYDPKISVEALKVTGGYLKEMLEVMPAIFVLSSLINVWVPREVIIRNFGADSGIRGRLASLVIGSVSAGPIYAAFPLTQSLLLKGASIGNIVVIISAWAVIKIPMIFVETKFLGAKFAATRYLLTLPCILLMSLICERLIKREDVIKAASAEDNELKKKILEALPGYNCGACGFRDCNECADAIARSESEIEVCKPGGKKVEKKITSILGTGSPSNL